jgi:outer membrane protein assembly factor BamE (lipoprotein component of BamABCDE complex)
MWITNSVSDQELFSVQRGMAPAEVRKLLGEPQHISKHGIWEDWHYGFTGIVVFQDGKVAYPERD